MVVFNRILNIFIVLLAIAIVVFSVKLYNVRKELRERGDTLASKVSTVAKELSKDAYPENDITSKVNGGSEGNLGWKTWHNDRGSYEANLRLFGEKAEDVISQRDAAAKSLIKMAFATGWGTYKYPLTQSPESPGYEKALKNDSEKAGSIFDSVEVHLKELETRDEAMRDEFIKIATRLKDGDVLGSGPEVEFNKDFMFHSTHTKAGEKLQLYTSEEDDTPLAYTHGYNEVFNYISTTIASIVEDRNKRGDGLEKIAKIFKERTDGKIHPTDAQNASTEAVKKGDNDEISKITSSIEALMDKANEVDQLKEEIATLKKEIKDKTREIDEKNHQIETLQTNAVSLKAQLKQKNEKISELNEKILVLQDDKNPIHVNANISGVVKKVDYDWGYVMIDKGANNKLKVNLTMTIHRGSEYICKAVVRKVYKEFAICDILPGEKVGDAVIGDKIFYKGIK